MNHSMTVSARKLMADNLQIDVHVSGLRMALLRLRLAMPLLWLAAKVAGVGLSIDINQRPHWHSRG
jgi:hypothetical protein